VSGAVLALDGAPLTYGAGSLAAPPFIAVGDPALRALVARLGRGGASDAKSENP
jgi:hypothetical protein